MTEVLNGTTAFLALGSNLGNRAANLAQAVALIAEHPAVSIVQQSRWYVSSAWYVTDQPDFFNGVLHIETTLSAFELLETVLEIEHVLGRQREIDKGPRTIDIDILLFGDAIIDNDRLQIPHPAMWERPFVMVPLVEIAPLVTDPVTGESALLQLGLKAFDERLEWVPSSD